MSKSTAALLLSSLLAGACTPGDDGTGREPLRVFAASSLIEAFQAMEREFEATEPGIDVRPTFAGSQILRLQLEQGATADVFASANEEHMRALVDAAIVARAETFARNELVVVVPVDGSAVVDSFTDLPRATRLVIGTDNVPVGVYTRQLLERARAHLGNDFASAVLDHVVSEESNVRLARAKVELGEADAAIVYRTDAVSSAGVRAVPVPDPLNVRASYTIGPVAASDRPEIARRFIAYVLSPEGQAILERHGFVRAPR